ncbi:MAG: hypothetical protein OXC46_11275 [Thaumarchaeota archaeon]|nr:hypothetical protein [Nitrososphaerota archaeon]
MPVKFAFLVFSIVLFSISLHSKSRSTAPDSESLYANMVKCEPVQLTPIRYKLEYIITNDTKLVTEIGCK